MMEKFLLDAARVAPSPRQKRWFDIGFYAFVHFGVNTFTDREWGDGTEAESLFNPTDLDCGQWVEAIQAAGMKGPHPHRQAPRRLLPLALEVHGAQRQEQPLPGGRRQARLRGLARAGIPFGFYLSPWDRNSPLYGTPAYNDYFCNQLTELLTGYARSSACGLTTPAAKGRPGRSRSTTSALLRPHPQVPAERRDLQRLRPGRALVRQRGRRAAPGGVGGRAHGALPPRPGADRARPPGGARGPFRPLQHGPLHRHAAADLLLQGAGLLPLRVRHVHPPGLVLARK